MDREAKAAGEQALSVFIGTYENKIDRKGRVSVPAQFRRRLEGQSFNGIVCFPSHRDQAIEACGMDFVERLSEDMEAYNLFSDEHSALATSLFSDAHELAFDIDGRVMLPEELRAIAGITDRVAFVGKGKLFQIWEPEAARQHKDSSRQSARGLSLPQRGGNGGAS